MKARWYRVDFTCACGLPGTILEVSVCMDGSIAMTGLCIPCGKEFTLEDSMALLISKSAIKDFIRCKEEKPEEFLLADFNPKGKPS
jgi:hypothetical protein